MVSSSHLPSDDSPSYGIIAKILHHLVLTFPVIGQTAFDMEKMFFRPVKNSDGQHVFICGLARAGTTAVLLRLYESGRFRSLMYRDMPFVLAPNSWHKISRFFLQEKNVKQRAHCDGITIGQNSPEAFEEIFWKTFFGFEYIKDDCLVPMSGESNYCDTFKTFVSLVLNTAVSGQRYLSKNNNNVLRMQVIAESFPNAIFIIPFRDPVQQAWSLRKQHYHFLRMHAEDSFAAKYMSWQAHYEFGSDHRPNRFDQTAAKSCYNTDSLAYWVDLWIETYSFILNHLPQRNILLNYEMLCEDTDTVWGAVLQRLELSEYGYSMGFENSCRRIDEILPEALRKKAHELYNALTSSSTGFVGGGAF